MTKFKLTPAQVSDYNRDGYVIIRNFLQQEEVSKLYKIAIEDDTMQKHSFDLNDQTGKKTKLALWYTPGNDA
ncbi:MAG: phytanoyl-CoA dioxygenase family protein, partial [Bacteroidota bacterium]